MRWAAVIVAAGSGTRLGRPKQFIALAGLPMVGWSIQTLASMPEIAELAIATEPESIEPMTALAERLAPHVARRVVRGGATRQESARRGVAVVDPSCEAMLIHDGARPLVTAHDVRSGMQAVAKGRASLLAAPVVDTIKAVDPSSGRVVQTLQRTALWAAQTPQFALAADMREAHARGEGESPDATDDAALLERIGVEVVVVPATAENFKVTLPGDLARAQAILEGRVGPRNRVGHGFDAHRLVDGRSLILGGIRVPFERGPLAHSDGDVLAHAISDALLGAAALGDLGGRFPDTDPQWKDADSLSMLAQCAAAVREAGFAIENVDATVVVERPRLAPFVERIRHNVAARLELPLERVCVKAKSSEGMGYTGDGTGIAAYAVACLVA